MLKILDILINALVAWRSRIVINRQKQDLCCLEGKENPVDAGFKPMQSPALKAHVNHVVKANEANPEPVYFPGFTQKEIEEIVKK